MDGVEIAGLNGDGVKQLSVTKRTRQRMREVDETFAWEVYRSACIAIFDKLRELEDASTFWERIDESVYGKGSDLHSMFKGYEHYVPEPSWLGAVEERFLSGGKASQADNGSSEKRSKQKTNKVSHFIKKVRQVFINALRFWRNAEVIRQLCYALLAKFNGMIFEAMPGIEQLLHRDRFVDPTKVAICRTAIDRVLKILLESPVLLPVKHKKNDAVSADLAATDHVHLLDTLSRLNHEEYVNEHEFISDVTKTLELWLSVSSQRGLASVQKEVKKALKTFKAEVAKIRSPTVGTSKDEGDGAGSVAPTVPDKKLLPSQLKRAIDKLMVADVQQIFATPVDVPGYRDVIKRPMDFGTIRKNLKKYETAQDFINDVDLVFSNCEKYSKARYIDVYKMSLRIKKVWSGLREELLGAPLRKLSISIPSGTSGLDGDKASGTKRKASFGGGSSGGKKKKRKNSEPLKVVAADTFPEAKAAAQALNAITLLEDAIPFLEPVPWSKTYLPNYGEVIKHPMDLGTIGKKLSDGKYHSLKAFEHDIHLVFKNCLTFNIDVPVNKPIRAQCKRLESAYKKSIQVALAAAPPPPPASVSPAKKEHVVTLKTESAPAAGSPSAAASSAFPRSMCRKILETLRRYPATQPFRQTDFKNIEGYLDKIKEPMDMKKVQKRLGTYTSVDEFARDVHLIFDNALKFNETETKDFPVRTWAIELKDSFDNLLNESLLALEKKKKKKKKKDEEEDEKRIAAKATAAAAVQAEAAKKAAKKAAARERAESLAAESVRDRQPSISDGANDNAPIRIKVKKKDKDKKEKKKEKKKKDKDKDRGRERDKEKDKDKDHEREKKRDRAKSEEMMHVAGEKIKKKKHKNKGNRGDLLERLENVKVSTREPSASLDETAPPPPPPPPPPADKHVKIKIKRLGDEPPLGVSKKPKKDRPATVTETAISPVEIAEPKVPAFEAPKMPNREFAPWEKQCRDIVTKLARTEWANVLFGRPVLESWPDMRDSYLAVVKKPMDLRTVLEQLFASKYTSPAEVDQDVQLMFDNAFAFNADGSLVTQHLRKKFEHLHRYWVHLFTELPDADQEARRAKRMEREERLENEPLTGFSLSAGIRLIKRLAAPKYRQGFFFHHPVEVDKWPDYSKIVAKPMDFTTLRNNAKRRLYDKAGGVAQFLADGRLIFTNCLLYNGDTPQNAQIRGIAKMMQTAFENEAGLYTWEVLERFDRTRLSEEMAVELEVEKRVHISNHALTDDEVSKLREQVAQTLRETRVDKSKRSKSRSAVVAPERVAIKVGDDPDQPAAQVTIPLDPELPDDDSEEEHIDDIYSDEDPKDEEYDEVDFHPQPIPGVGHAPLSHGSQRGPSHRVARGGALFGPGGSLTDRRLHRHDAVDDSRYLKQVERAKEESLARLKELEDERTELEARAERRRERERQRAEQAEREEAAKFHLAESKIQALQGARLTLKPRRRNKPASPQTEPRVEMDGPAALEPEGLEPPASVAAAQSAWQQRVLSVKSKAEMAEGKNVSSPAPQGKPAPPESAIQQGQGMFCVKASCIVPVGASGGTRPASASGALLALTCRISQRQVSVDGLDLCLGSLWLSTATRDEYQAWSSTPATPADATLEGTSMPILIPVTERERQEGANPSRTIVFRTKSYVERASADALGAAEKPVSNRSRENSLVSATQKLAPRFAAVVRKIFSTPLVDSRSGDLADLAPALMAARRFVELEPEILFLDGDEVNPAKLGEALGHWSFHKAAPLATSKPATETRGSREYVVVRFIGLEGQITASVGDAAVLAVNVPAAKRVLTQPYRPRAAQPPASGNVSMPAPAAHQQQPRLPQQVPLPQRASTTQPVLARSAAPSGISAQQPQQPQRQQPVQRSSQQSQPQQQQQQHLQQQPQQQPQRLQQQQQQQQQQQPQQQRQQPPPQHQYSQQVQPMQQLNRAVQQPQPQQHVQPVHMQNRQHPQPVQPVQQLQQQVAQRSQPHASPSQRPVQQAALQPNQPHSSQMLAQQRAYTGQGAPVQQPQMAQGQAQPTAAATGQHANYQMSQQPSR